MTPAVLAFFFDVASVLGSLQSADAREQLVVSAYLAAISDAGQGSIHCAGPDVNVPALRQLAGPALMSAPSGSNAAPVIMRTLARSFPCGDPS
jgi:hypothetical protein